MSDIDLFGGEGRILDFPSVKPEEFVEALRLSHEADSPVRARLASACFKILYSGIATEVGSAIDKAIASTPTPAATLQLVKTEPLDISVYEVPETTPTEPLKICVPFELDSEDLLRMDSDQTPTQPNYVAFRSILFEEKRDTVIERSGVRAVVKTEEPEILDDYDRAIPPVAEKRCEMSDAEIFVWLINNYAEDEA